MPGTGAVVVSCDGSDSCADAPAEAHTITIATIIATERAFTIGILIARRAGNWRWWIIDPGAMEPLPAHRRLERQRDAVRPAESILGRILAATGRPLEIANVVLLHHPARRLIGPPVEREPSRAGLGGEIIAAVSAHALDAHPLEGRPPIGRVPLLTRRDRGRDEATGLEKIALQTLSDRAALLG